MVTKGARRIGRTIRKIENSVEFSTKETRVKKIESNDRAKTQTLPENNDNSPIQSLRGFVSRKKDST